MAVSRDKTKLNTDRCATVNKAAGRCEPQRGLNTYKSNAPFFLSITTIKHIEAGNFCKKHVSIAEVGKSKVWETNK